MSKRTLHAVLHASELLTGAGVRAKDGRQVTESDLGRISDGALVYEPRGKVVWVGPTKKLPRALLKEVPAKRRVDLGQAQTIVPGFVDCHTHLVFAGDRENEFAARCAGATYQEIAASGGGIMATVRSTRNATAAELEHLAAARVEESAHFGVRTFEIKSGYGLSVEAELKSLEVIRRLKKRFPQYTFHATFLGEHEFPPEYPRDVYL